MKTTFIKQPGGVLIPADDMEAAKMERFKTGDYLEIDIKVHRNPRFHNKVFAFFRFCFAHWRGVVEFKDEVSQFEVFRNHLTVLAGYYNEFVNINGEIRIEAKSLSYSSMKQDEFEQCYSALINAAMKHIFRTTDEQTFNQLQSFF